jgi:hypothetical protein
LSRFIPCRFPLARERLVHAKLLAEAGRLNPAEHVPLCVLPSAYLWRSVTEPPRAETRWARASDRTVSTGVGPLVTEVTGGSRPDGLGCLRHPRERGGFSHARSAFHPLTVHLQAIVSPEAPFSNIAFPKEDQVRQGVSRASAISTDPQGTILACFDLRAFSHTHRGAYVRSPDGELFLQGIAAHSNAASRSLIEMPTRR